MPSIMTLLYLFISLTTMVGAEHLLESIDVNEMSKKPFVLNSGELYRDILTVETSKLAAKFAKMFQMQVKQLTRKHKRVSKFEKLRQPLPNFIETHTLDRGVPKSDEEIFDFTDSRFVEPPSQNKQNHPLVKESVVELPNSIQTNPVLHLQDSSLQLTNHYKNFKRYPLNFNQHTYSTRNRLIHYSTAKPAYQTKPKTTYNFTPAANHYTTPKPTYLSVSKPTYYSTPKPTYYSTPKPAYHSTPKPIYYSTPKPAYYSTPKLTFSSTPKTIDYSTPKPVYYSTPSPLKAVSIAQAPTPKPPINPTPSPIHEYTRKPKLLFSPSHLSTLKPSYKSPSKASHYFNSKQIHADRHIFSTTLRPFINLGPISNSFKSTYSSTSPIFLNSIKVPSNNADSSGDYSVNLAKPLKPIVNKNDEVTLNSYSSQYPQNDQYLNKVFPQRRYRGLNVLAYNDDFNSGY